MKVVINFNSEHDKQKLYGILAVEYKPIEKFEQYSISTHGIMKNAKGIIIKPFITNSGYEVVRVNNVHVKQQKFLVHRLVALHFIPNPENKLQVNHKDGNKINNCVENLEWVTGSENMRHAFDSGRMEESKAKARVRMAKIGTVYGRENGIASQSIKEQSIIQKTLDGIIVNVFASLGEAKRITGINGHIIAKLAISGLSRNGFVFEIQREYL